MIPTATDAIDLDAPIRASRSPRALARFAIGLAALFAATVMLTLTVWATVVPAIMGWKPVSVVSGSMEPLIGIGDVVLADPGWGEAISPGMVVVFRDASGEGLITHRVHDVRGDGSYTTKGDANLVPDSTPLIPDRMVGVGRLLVPGVGWPAVWAGRGDTRALVITGTIWALTLYLARWGVLNRFDPWGQEQSARSKPAAVRGRHLRRRQAGPARIVLGAGTLLGSSASVIALSLSSAVLTASTVNGPSAVRADSDFSYSSVVQADNPSFWWRLGEDVSTPGTFTEDFEGAFSWTDYLSGTLVSSSSQARTGTYSALKGTNNDPNGGWRQLGFSSGTTWTLEAWIYRPSPIPGGAADRLALEDSAFNGYGIQINHNSNVFLIERRTSGSATTLASVSYDPPENDWYRVVLARTGSSLQADLYDSGGSLQSTVSTTDSTHGPADRVVVHGGYTYHVDDVTVTATGGTPPSTAIDSQGNLNGTYSGSPSWGQGSLVSGETDTSVSFDGSSWVMIGDDSLLNLATRSQRSVELWFEASSTTGRQVLYEEGGTVNGMVIYLDGSNLRARAWSDSTSWSNELDTTTPITISQTYHVVVTLDTAATDNLILYVDGTRVSSHSKPDTGSWNAHSDDGGIAAQNGGTRYHDGNSSGSGSNGFQGTIDDVSIYNTVLDPSRVMAHWVAGRP